LGPIPNPQSPIPNPQYENELKNILFLLIFFIRNYKNKI